MSPSSRKKKLKWDDLVAAEPKLHDMEAEAWRAWRSGKPALIAWYTDELRYRLPDLVGWDRKGHPVLGSEEAYDVAYDHLLGIVERPRPRRKKPSRHRLGC